MISRRALASGAVSLAAGAALGESAAARAGFAWPRGARAAVSLTYDDGLDSQVEHAVPALDAMGLKGTFFLTQENMEARLPDWQAVARRGHEMANHTISHPCDLKRCTAASFHDQEIAPMEAFLDQSFGPDRFRSYAYPCGYTALGAGPAHQGAALYKAVLRGSVTCARTVGGPPNNPRWVTRDPYMLHGFEPTYDVDDPVRARPYVRQAMAEGGWAILVFHDVLPRRAGEGDTSAAAHQAILDWLAAQSVWCAPLGEVYRYCAARSGPAAPGLARRQGHGSKARA